MTTSLTLVRRIKAPPERVFAAWTRAELLATWFGPHHTSVLQAEVDARPEGRFRVQLQERTGAIHEAAGRYLEVNPPEALVFTWAWTDRPERESRVSVRFRPVPEGTEVTLTHDRFADPATAQRHTRGWTESLDRLTTSLA